MARRFFLILLPQLLFFCCKAQDTLFTYFFDEQLKPADSASAAFYAKGVKADSLFSVSYYFTATSQLVGVEEYSDASLTVKEGRSILFHNNGHPRSLQTFKNNVLQGVSIGYDFFSHPIDSMVFDNNRKVSNIHFQYHENGQLKQRREENFLTNSTKEHYPIFLQYPEQ